MSLSVALLLLFTLVGRGLAILVNYTIDDAGGDPMTGDKPSYHPLNEWHQGATCDGCGLKVQPISSAFNSTWHDATYHAGSQELSINISFTGASRFNPRCVVMDSPSAYNPVGFAIYVYFITAPVQLDQYYVIKETHLNITLDEEIVDSYDYAPSPDTVDFQFNQLVYHNSSLTSNPHTLVISSGGNLSSILAFDYANYTTDANEFIQPSSSLTLSSSGFSTLSPTLSPTLPPASTKTLQMAQRVAVGAIVGGVTGGLAVICLLTLLFFYRRRSNGGYKRNVLLDDDSDYMTLRQGSSWSQTPDDYLRMPVSGIDSLIPAVLELNNQEQDSLIYGYVSPFPTTGSQPERVTTMTSSIVPQTKAEIRQIEIRRRMQEVQQEMEDMELEYTASQMHPRPNDDDLRVAVEHMRVEIEKLKEAQYSQWGNGLSNELPPVYA